MSRFLGGSKRLRCRALLKPLNYTTFKLIIINAKVIKHGTLTTVPERGLLVTAHELIVEERFCLCCQIIHLVLVVIVDLKMAVNGGKIF